MKLTTQEITKELKETIKWDLANEFDTETVLSIYNGLVISYLKANGEYNTHK